uniref:Glutathione S-transferase kappa 1 n=1 Tax=Nephromyces sp. MMRI TaxID=2496275 RepID=A0A3Q8UC14_9APIC|nr:glutathione S-transferase kappa 1 [Nephromyces sp. MMRI]
MRILTATKRLFPDKLWDVSFAFFETYFVYCNNITDQSCLLSAIKKTTLSQSSINDILTLSETQNIKDALKIATSDAINIGIFGCPTFAVLRDQINKDKLRVFTKKKCLNQYEIFFGADRLHLLAYYLNLPFFGPFQNSHNQSNEAKL